MNITDQLAQALEELIEPMRRYEQDSDTWPYKEEVARTADALAAYRASKEGEKADGYDKSRPYCPHCNFPSVSLGSYVIDLNTGKLLDPSEQHEH